MSIGRADAVVLLDAWAADRALVRVELRFGVVAAAFRGRLIAASETAIRVVADDEWTELVLPLRDDFTFGFVDMQPFPESDAFEHGLAIFFQYDGDPADADYIVLAEIKE